MSTARERQREAMRQWFKDRPTYYKTWTREYQQWRDAERAKGNNVRGNSRPRINGQLAYEIIPTVTLTKEERNNHVESESIPHQ